MNRRITDFGLTKKKRENPEKFNLVPTHDGKTGQLLFKPRLQSKQDRGNDYVRTGAVTARETETRGERLY